MSDYIHKEFPKSVGKKEFFVVQLIKKKQMVKNAFYSTSYKSFAKKILVNCIMMQN